MCNSATITLSDEEARDPKIASLLNQAERLLDITRVRVVEQIVKNSVELPFIHTDDGNRFYGNAGLERFVRRERLIHGRR